MFGLRTGEMLFATFYRFFKRAKEKSFKLWLASMVLSTAAAVVFSLWPLSPLQPLFVGLLVSAGVLMVGALRQRGTVPSERTEERNPTP